MSSSRNPHKINCVFLLFAMLLYHSQGVIIPKASIIGPILAMMIVAISIIYLGKLLLQSEKFSQILIIWLLFLIINVCYFLLTGHFKEDFSIIQQVILNFVPFFAFYYFTQERILTRRNLIIFTVILLPILIMNFYNSLGELQAERGEENVVDNAVYPLIGILPFVLLIRKKIIAFVILMVIWFVMVQSSKRVAIVCGVLAFILFIYQILFASRTKYKFQSYLVGLFMLGGVTYFAFDFYQSNLYLQQRISLMLEGESSGRDTLIKGLFNAWYQSDKYIHYLFGLGFNAAKRYTAHVAHNDWIKVLGNFGLLGLVVYIVLWKSLITEALQKCWDKNKKVIVLLTLCIAFISSMTFRWYQSPFPYMNAILLPYLIASKTSDI